MLDDQALRDLASELVRVDGVVGVVLGGSRARSDHTPESVVEVGLYYLPPLDLPCLRTLAERVAGPTATLTEPGGWGPGVDGGGWSRIRGTAVDWIYRDVDRVRACWAEACAGRYVFHVQVGHPLGVPDFAYPGELALAVVLSDPSGALSDLQQQVRDYPPALGGALVRGLGEAEFALQIARKAVLREDTAYVAGCLFRAVLLCAHALHGRAGRWLVDEKGAVAAAGRLPGAPARFDERAHDVLARLGRSPDELGRAIDVASALVQETIAACER